MATDLTGRIANGRTDLVLPYLADGHPARGTDDYGTPLLIVCADLGDVSAVRLLLQHGESLTTLGRNHGLDGAAFHGHWQLCEFLIEQGADVNLAAPDTGETPLHAALCKANRPVYDRIVEVLLAGGANPNCATIPGVITEGFMRDCRTKGETPLHRAAAFGSERVIRALLNAGAVIDAHDANGETPLSWASWHLRPAAVLLALCYGPYSIHPGNTSTYDHGMGW